jgi:hypothetical protein
MNRFLFLSPILSLVACGGAGGGGTGGGGAAAIAVINSDFKMATVLSLVAADGSSLVTDDCLDSGSVTPRLSTALSGDVVLPSAPQPDGEVLLLDRSNAALTWVVPASCTVDRQISAGSFYANPHDLVALSATKAYVTRFEANPTPSGVPGAHDKGSDVLIIDPSTGGATGSIDLAPYASAGVLARPDRAVAAGGKVYVNLGNVSADFAVVGTGGIVVIDAATDQVSGVIDLAPYKSCAQLEYLAPSQTLLVGCGGDYNDPVNQAAASAILAIDVSGATPTVKKLVDGTATGGRPINSSVFTAAGDNLLVVATFGDYVAMTPADQLWAVTLDGGAAATKIADGDSPGVFAGVHYLPERQRVLVSDASMTKPVVRVYDVSAPGAIHEVTTFEANPKSGLPPRQLARF